MEEFCLGRSSKTWGRGALLQLQPTRDPKLGFVMSGRTFTVKMRGNLLTKKITLRSDTSFSIHQGQTFDVAHSLTK